MGASYVYDHQNSIPFRNHIGVYNSNCNLARVQENEKVKYSGTCGCSKMMTLCKLLIFRQGQCVIALLCRSFSFALHHLTAGNR